MGKMRYTEQELVRIAKRENNKKRNYLVVNRLQGKHIPVSPKEAFAMFGQLADLIEEAYAGERLLLVGFAETATAIGAALAVQLDSFYMQTTREQIEGVEYLYFSENHSHAVEQRLVKTDLDQIADEIDRIVFVEDEITTGNTILNIIRLIEETYEKKFSFSVASLLNGMDEEAKRRYFEKGISLHYLVRTDHRSYVEKAERFRGDGIYHLCDQADRNVRVKNYEISFYHNARRLGRGGTYFLACEKLWKEIEKKIKFCGQKKILVAGTEEFMYPALFVGEKLEEVGHRVLCHSTTRSPIIVSREAEYPLHERYELVSLYERGRKTFFYNMDSYDEVFIITDAPCVEEGVHSLVNAIVSCGNQDIYLIRWC